MLLLHIARITDASATGGKTNLTIRNLPSLISDAATKAKVAGLADTAIKAPDFCRDWRNRHIGHTDLQLATGERQRRSLMQAASKSRTRSRRSRM